MAITPRFHWLIRLRDSESRRKGKVLHLAASDEHGDARSSTLCGKRYDPADRIYASKGIKAITGREYRIAWRVHAFKQIQPGDEVFLLKQGQEPRGLMAHGRVIRVLPRDRPRGHPPITPRAEIAFDLVLRPQHGSIIPRSALDVPEVASA